MHKFVTKLGTPLILCGGFSEDFNLGKEECVSTIRYNRRFSRPKIYADEDKIQAGRFPELVIDLGLVFG
jgi:hypothetical protein